ncbi:hypothetical protein ABZY83_35430 [Streptomyces virginiae]|uniref:hypothetical protein n=1 Tax=Streptomyces TaxID=1883 RepID=UPI0006AE9B22|nr:MULTISPECIES: hypothetical protein [unclassified Streptomyces]KOU60461.1 hypothetical protein ADK96_30780 [Streptomyces sp. IGB124]KOU71153.1 hypothetical protein ADK61_31630 [Streptomyces sp. XY66]KOU81821.1 hypothetical protein ADK93_30150 [Streptomyces sp. XY58]KOV02608.1 hypothetical protein ADK89_29255 [Streptomyces sp. XY37]KOV15149.1 hypothetical protein ADK90_31925 [Streptomyces sp. XY413]
MLNTKRAGRTEPEPLEPLDSGDDAYPEDGEYLDDAEGFEIHHAICPDCGQSIALVADEEYLPQHALCLTPWNPFGLTVCAGTGRPATDALPSVGALPSAEAQELELDPFTLPALPQGLDWRTQPFSHVGGPGSRPIRVVRPVLPQPQAQTRQQHAQAA